jgi:CheY-like chemotaxis protein
MDKEGPSAKVLVVEDVALIRLTTVEMVEAIGLAAADAADAQEALAMLKEDDGISVLITDLGLPGMSGRQLVEEALRLNPGLKVIVASGYSEEGFDAKVGVLRKPFDLQQLQRALHSVLSEG